MHTHPVVSRADWLAARTALLEREKAHSRAGEELAAARRALPWVAVEKDYVFETEAGPRTLADLFDGRSQLIVYHFMFGPGWEEGCTGCSFLADHYDGANLHLAHHDVTLLAASRAPLAELLPFKRRMGWRFPWVSSAGSDFNYDFDASFRPEDVAAGRATYNYEPYGGDMQDLHGLSVFVKGEDGRVYHTYSTYGRGGDALIGAHHFLDLTPKGRNEDGTMDWVRLHDRYEDAAAKPRHGPAPEASCCAAE
jgi:predicted dithiol-disulfide oxidoreductase (DUF899 family)